MGYSGFHIPLAFHDALERPTPGLAIPGYRFGLEPDLGLPINPRIIELGSHDASDNHQWFNLDLLFVAKHQKSV